MSWRLAAARPTAGSRRNIASSSRPFRSPRASSPEFFWKVPQTKTPDVNRLSRARKTCNLVTAAYFAVIKHDRPNPLLGGRLASSGRGAASLLWAATHGPRLTPNMDAARHDAAISEEIITPQDHRVPAPAAPSAPCPSEDDDFLGQR